MYDQELYEDGAPTEKDVAAIFTLAKTVARVELHEQTLDVMGIKKLGAGCYGAGYALTKFPGWVLKISMVESALSFRKTPGDKRSAKNRARSMQLTHQEYGTIRDAWAEWAMFSFQNRNPLTPDILALECGENTSVAIVRQYYPVADYAPTRELGDYLENAELIEAMEHLWENGTDNVTLENLQEIAGVFQGKRIDMHSDNVMLDKRMNWVLTDPFCYASGDDSRYIGG